MADLSPTQADVLAKLKEHGRLERLPGGFWTYPGCARQPYRNDDVPVWYTGVSTLRALERKGYVRCTERQPRFNFELAYEVANG